MSRVTRTLILLSFAAAVCLSLSTFLAHSPPADALALTPYYLPLVQHHDPPTPTPHIALTVVQTQRRGVTDMSSHYVSVGGIVNNEGNVNMTGVQVISRLYHDGSVTAEWTAPVDMQILRPGETSPFYTSVYYCCPELVDYHTVDVTGVQTSAEPYRDLAVINERSAPIGGGDKFAEYWGEVVNTGSVSLEGGMNGVFNIYTVFFDADGKFVDRASYRLAGHLGPGIKAPFDHWAHVFRPVASWQHWVQAQPLPPGQHAVHPVVTVNSIVSGDYGALSVTGHVLNPSTVPLQRYTIYVVFRNAKGEVVDFIPKERYDVSSDPLAPGATESLSLWIDGITVPSQYASVDFYSMTEYATAP